MIKFDPPRYVKVVHKTQHEGEWHTFGFVYEEQYHTNALRNLGIMAADSEVPFTWYDAAVVSQEMRNQLAHMQAEQASTPEIKNSAPKQRFA